MFRALDCLYDEKPVDNLGNFLSDANPYLFTDHSSADPAIEVEFNTFAAEYIKGQDLNYENTYDMVVHYLEKYTSFSERFKEIDLEEWSSLYDIVEQEEMTANSYN